MLKKLLFLASLCTLLFTAPSALAQDETSQVAGAAEQLRVLLLKPDTAKLKDLIANELSYGHSSGKVDSKASLIESLVSGDSQFPSLEVSGQSIRIVNNAAIVRHVLQGETISKGTPGKIKLQVLTIWQKQADGWKLIARQAVAIK